MIATIRHTILIILVLAAGTVAALATTIVVRDDAAMLNAAEAVVDATVEDARPVLHPNGRVYTHVRLLVHEVWKGHLSGSFLTVVEMGGVTQGAMDWVPGTPDYVQGARVVAFLIRGANGNWQTLDMWAGLFRVRETQAGRAVVLRGQAEDGVLLYGPRFQPFRDFPRDFAAFRSWVRSRQGGSTPDIQYRISGEELREAGGLVAEAEQEPVTTKWALMGNGIRWHEYDSGGVEGWYYGNAPQVGFVAGSTSGDGPAEFSRALATWQDDPTSTIRLNDLGAHIPYGSGWNGGADGYSEVLFNDPYDEIPGDFDCSSGGTLGFGGIHAASGSHTFRGQTWWSATEGDVVMQSWTQDCSWLDSEDLTEILAHEVGHALGFGHSYDSGEAHNQLTDDALMRWIAHGGSLADTLGEDDRCAAYWLYPASRVDTALSPNSTVTVSPATVSAGGSATVTVHLDSGSGPVSGRIVRGWIETISGAASGTLDRGNAYPDAPFTDQGTGDYYAILTAGPEDGQLRVHIKINCCDDAVPAPDEPCDPFTPTATLTVASGPFPGDANGDNVVDGADLVLTVQEIFDMDGTATADRCSDGPCPQPEVDGDGDGDIDAADLAVVIKNSA